MKQEEILRQWRRTLGISAREYQNIISAVGQVYPMIVWANLTKNTYSMLRNDDFLSWSIESTGTFDSMIDEGVQNIHPNYQQVFLDCFSRESLLKSFNDGKTDVYAELYQKAHDGRYQWVSTHAIRVEVESDDIIEICLNRVLDGVVKTTYADRK
jgi:hypothetical protein